MIRVERGPKPDGFDTRSTALLQQFREERLKNPKLTAADFWSKVRRKLAADAALLAERCHGKCAFCEARPEPCSAGQVEHYQPKSRAEFEPLMFRWDNWLHSCGRCNQKKWAHFPDCEGTPCLLGPAADQPEQHLTFEATRILWKSERGRRTVELVGLDRSPLSDDRARWLAQIDIVLLLVRWVPEARSAAREFLIWSMQANAPYAAMTRAYLVARVPRLAQPDQAHPQVLLDDPVRHLRLLVDEHGDTLRDFV